MGTTFFEEFLNTKNVDENLTNFLNELQVTSSEKEKFKEDFLNNVQANKITKENLKFLNENNIPIEYATAGEDSYCKSAAALSYHFPKRKVVMCVKGGKQISSTLTSFNHEVLHIKQGLGLDVKMDCTFGTRQTKFQSNSMQKYTMNPKYRSEELNVSVISLKSKERQEQYSNMLEQFDQIERFFFIDTNPDGTVKLSPKKNTNISDSDFFNDFTRKLYLKPQEKKKQSQAGKMIAKSKYKHIYDAFEGSNIEDLNSTEDIQKLLEAKLSQNYTSLIEQVEPDEKETVKNIIEKYYVTINRIYPYLATYCDEIQANMQSVFYDYFKWLMLTNVEKCDEYSQSLSYKFPEGKNIFSRKFYEENGFNFGLVDKIIEEFAVKLVSKPTSIYGKKFSELYGFEGFNDIFNSNNCTNFNPNFKRFRP